MPLNAAESAELSRHLRFMSRKNDVVGVKDSPGSAWGGFHYWCLYGWRVTGEPIFKHQDSWKWKDSRGLDVKEEDVNMFIVFCTIWKGYEKIFVDRYYGWKFITPRLIGFQNLNDAAKDLGLKVKIDAVSLWLYIDDTAEGTSVIKPGQQEELAAILLQILKTMEELRKKTSGQGSSSTTKPKTAISGIDTEIDRLTIAVRQLQRGFN